eukprot:scaffold60839_cov20-Tisochrysis_lutea.AAC.3
MPAYLFECALYKVRSVDATASMPHCGKTCTHILLKHVAVSRRDVVLSVPNNCDGHQPLRNDALDLSYIAVVKGGVNALYRDVVVLQTDAHFKPALSTACVATSDDSQEAFTASQFRWQHSMH